jgi:hypothetical protein
MVCTSLKRKQMMISCNEEEIGERLRHLLAACNETAAVALQLVARAPADSLRDLLHERSECYRRSAEEIAGCLQSLPQDAEARSHPVVAAVMRGADVASAWEAAECDALIHFRDALDAELPAHAEEAVVRHIEDGVRALERLRELRSTLPSGIGSRSHRHQAT